MNTMITVSEAANQLGVTPATVYVWVKSGKIAYVRYTSKTIRIPQIAIDKLMTVHNA